MANIKDQSTLRKHALQQGDSGVSSSCAGFGAGQKEFHRSRDIKTICQIAEIPSEGKIFQDDHSDEIEFSMIK